MDENRELHRTFTLSEQLAASNHCKSLSSDDENTDSEDNNNTNTKTPVSTRYRYENYDKNRTLLDIIKDESEVDDSLISHTAATNTRGNNSIGLNWQSFKKRLRLCRTGSAAFRASVSHHSPISESELAVNPHPQQPAFFHSFSRNVNAGRETGNSDEEDGEEDEKVEVENARTMSLMALLRQSDDQWDDEEDEENAEGLVGEAEEEDEEDRGEVETACCVCMVRHKGAAFIPCGHTFCRLCSRELWVSRGNCPLCNAFIREILDIF